MFDVQLCRGFSQNSRIIMSHETTTNTNIPIRVPFFCNASRPRLPSDRVASDSEAKLPQSTISQTAKVNFWLQGSHFGAVAATNNDIEIVTNFVSESLRKDVVIEKSVNDIVSGLQRYRVDAERDVSEHICGPLTALRRKSKNMDFTNYGRFSFLVLDTTILMSHLHFITDIINSDIERLFPGQLFLILPWVVLKELDGLSKTTDGELQRFAQRAVDFLINTFESSKEQIQNQCASNAMDDLINSKPESRSAFAQIIHCCQYYQKKGKVALLSNDRGLCHAARSRKVYGSNVEMLPKLLEKWFPNTGQLLPRQAVAVTENEASKKLLEDTKTILMPFLDMFVSQEMRNVYGQRFITPPWKDVIDVLRFIETYWPTVFAHCMRPTAKIHLDLMINKFTTTKGFITSSSIKSVVLESCQFLKKFDRKSKYIDVVKPTIEKLAIISGHNDREQPFAAPASQPVPLLASNEANDKTRGDEMTVIQKLFMSVWDSIKNICCCLCDCCEVTIPSSAAAGTYGTFLKRPVKQSDAYEFLPLFYPVITELKSLMHSVLQLRPSDKAESGDAYSKLCSALENYFVSLNLVPESYYVEEISQQSMRKFCLDSEKRKLVEKGLFALEEYCERTFHCILVIKNCCPDDIIDAHD